MSRAKVYSLVHKVFHVHLKVPWLRFLIVRYDETDCSAVRPAEDFAPCQPFLEAINLQCPLVRPSHARRVADDSRLSVGGNDHTMGRSGKNRGYADVDVHVLARMIG